MGDFTWTHALTLIGFAITISIAVLGFRSFSRWHNEQISSRRIDIAIKALALSYKSSLIFESIQSPMAYAHEWSDMPETGDPNMRSQRGSFYATLKRIERNKEFFEKAWELQVECAAVFGKQVGELFLDMQHARREIEVAAQMLWENPHPQNQTAEDQKFWNEMKAAVWGSSYAKAFHTDDKVGAKLTKFQNGIETICRPIIEGRYRQQSGRDRKFWFFTRST